MLEVFGHTISGQSGASLQTSNPKGLQDELARHVREDGQLSRFDFAVQFLDVGKMTYWQDEDPVSDENASIEWKKPRRRSTRCEATLA